MQTLLFKIKEMLLQHVIAVFRISTKTNQMERLYSTTACNKYVVCVPAPPFAQTVQSTS